MGKSFSLTSWHSEVQEGGTALHPSKWDTRKQTSDFALPWATSRSSTALPAFHNLKSDVEGDPGVVLDGSKWRITRRSRP